MKKWMGMLLAVAMILLVTGAYAAVPSKTTSDVGKVSGVQSLSGATIGSDFVVQIAVDQAPVVQEINALYNFVNDPLSPKAPIEYFPAETQEAVRAAVEATLGQGYDMSQMEINEIVTIGEVGYDAAYGDVSVSFSLATQYTPDQKVVALLGIYSGAVDENGNFVVEWVVANAQVEADGQISVVLTGDTLSRFATASTVSMAVLSTPNA